MGPLAHNPTSLEFLCGGLNARLVGTLVAIFVFSSGSFLHF